MTGRLENENRINIKINNKMKELPEYVYEWYSSLLASDKSARTCEDYVNKIRLMLLSISPDTKNIKPSDITFNALADYYTSLKSRNGNPTSDSFRITNWFALNSFISFMKEMGYIDKNYMNMIKKPKNKDLQRIKANRIHMTQEDFGNILKRVEHDYDDCDLTDLRKYLNNRDLLIMSLFMTTGMRKTALTEINVDDVDMENMIIHVVDKGNKRHKYCITDDECMYLKEVLKYRGKYAKNTKALFVSKYGNRIHINSVTCLVDKYCKDVMGMHISPHKLRGGFCSILYEETGDPKFVQEAVGHANMATTLRYITTDHKEKERAANIMSSILKK